MNISVVILNLNVEKLYPIYRATKTNEKCRVKVSLIRDTLVLNNQWFYIETIGDLPDYLHPRSMCERSNKETLVFGGMYSEFCTYSNWSKSAFTFKEKEFICIEQGYMYNKAVINGAPAAAQQIVSPILMRSKDWDQPSLLATVSSGML